MRRIENSPAGTKPISAPRKLLSLWPVALLSFVLAPLSRAQNAAPRPPRSLALLVGISAYPPNRLNKPAGDYDWKPLEGTCVRDVEQMRDMLTSRYGFKPKQRNDANSPTDDIWTLTDSQATKKAILDAFKTHLIDQARPGDTIVFQFSGHGQQIPNHDGSSFDGKDESLVPYDYITRSALDGDKTNLRDKEIHGLIKQLRTCLTGKDGNQDGSITLIVDSCHSGGIARGDSLLRGDGWEEKISGPEPKPKRPQEVESSGWIDPAEARAEGHVLLAACRSNELAGATPPEAGKQRMGAFTFCLLQAMDRATPQTTYRDLMDQVSVSIAALVKDHDQHPQMEGDVDRAARGGEKNRQERNLLAGFGHPAPVTPGKPYALASALDDGANANMSLPIGKLQGVTEDSVYALFGPDQDLNKTDQCRAKLTVVTADPAVCTLTLLPDYAGKINVKDLNGLRAVEIAHSYKTQPLRIYLSDASLASLLGDIEAVTYKNVTQSDCDIRIERDGGSLLLYHGGVSANAGATQTRGAGIPLAKLALPKSPEEADALRERLLGEWRWRFLTQMRNTLPAAMVKLEVAATPVKVDLAARKVVGPLPETTTTGGQRVYPDGGYFMLKVRNTGTTDAYVTLLVLLPDGSIRPLIPNPGLPDDVNKFKVPHDGTWYEFPEPYVFVFGMKGRQVIKVIGTAAPMDFSTLLYTPSSVNEGATRGGPLDQLFRSVRNARPRGALDDLNWNAAEWEYEVR
jgi:hypothetical protein